MYFKDTLQEKVMSVEILIPPEFMDLAIWFGKVLP